MYLLGQPIVQMKYRDVQTEFGHNKVLAGISVDILQLEILVK
jgi:ABC-type transporter Mla maintaining outer membrane lipid asymmetry ATPase subunit MlaF